ncbi:PIN domain-containing protein [Streptomyces sp. NPDC059466]|uniref:PIN domain-containing protein n=1 Tax=Streptomyces sp. NPDC059466 TaxID=3346843 RepID=UPI0036A1D54B
MIYLDTCIVRSLDLKDSSADLLRALRAVGERVGIPWMVAEELVAQRVINYREAHDSASAALSAVNRHTPWDISAQLEDPDVERVRKHWAAMYRTLAEILPSSSASMREALFREANMLPPCKKAGKSKTGSRDAVIWLSAVEYAREHPDETVYFVSENHRDFTRGSAYPTPMDTDVADLGDRFEHMTTLAEVVQRFTQPAKADEALSHEILDSSASLDAIAEAAKTLMKGTEPFQCTTSVGEVAQEVTISTAHSFSPLKSTLHTVSNVQAYRIGDHEWYTAVAVWHMAGVAFLGPADVSAAGVAWTTSVLFAPNAQDSRVTVLRHDPPQPLPAAEFQALGVNALLFERLAPMVTQFIEVLSHISSEVAPLKGLPRAYEGALKKQARQGAIERRLAKSFEHLEPDA